MKQLLLTLLAMNFLSLFANAQSVDPLAIGSPAPQITAVNQDGESINFSDIYAKGVTLVYFYPKAETPGCTAGGRCWPPPPPPC